MSDIENINKDNKIVVCGSCEASDRHSLDCKQCQGAGIGITSKYGFLVWNTVVDDFTIKFRAISKKVNLLFNLIVGLLLILHLSLFIWFAIENNVLTELVKVSFWFSSADYLIFFYIALILACFLIFRIYKFTHEVKVLPNWSLKKVKKDLSKKALDISVFLDEGSWSVLEQAYILAKDLNLIQITPEVLFAAVLTRREGNLFLLRLGLDFKKLSNPLSDLLSSLPAGDPPISFSLKSKEVLLKSFILANDKHRRYVTSLEIFWESFLASEQIEDLLDKLGYSKTHVLNVVEWLLMQDKLKEDQMYFYNLAKLKPKTGMNRAMTAIKTEMLDRFSEDLTLLAKQGYLSPMVGNDIVINNLLRGLESGQNSVVLVGETGVGKSAVIEQLARLMVEENVPEVLFDKRLVVISLPQVIAAGGADQASKRFLRILREVEISGNIVLVLYGLEALVGVGSQTMDLSETLATELDKHRFLVVATTTPQAWVKYLENRNLGKKLVKVDMPVADVQQTIRVLMARANSIEYKNRVFLSYSAIEKAAVLAKKYIKSVATPQSALNIIREAAVLTRKSKGERSFVDSVDVAKVVEEKTNIPVQVADKDEAKKLLSLEDEMHQMVIGQNEAVTAISRAIRRARADMQEGKRPIASFLFLGPTGVGKTETAKALAKKYFGDEQAMIRLDMSEYQNQTAVAKIIGSPGDERGGLLSEQVRKKPFSIVLLDEIEKAHPDILTLFLQVMDDGRITDGVGRVIDFTNTIIIMTSNAGSTFIQSSLQQGKSIEWIRTYLLEKELKTVFRPEFLNRFDAVIVYKTLTREEIVRITNLMLSGVAKRLEQKGVKMEIDDRFVEKIARDGYSVEFGARPLRRVIQDQVETPLADLFLQQKVDRHDTIVIKGDGEFLVKKDSL